MRKPILGILVGALVFSAGLARAETLADALAAAYQNSHLLEQNQALLRAADEDVAVAVASLRPVVEFLASAQTQYAGMGDPLTASYADSQSAVLQVVASMALYDFGRGKAAVGIAEQAVLATEQALRGVEQQVLLAAAEAYVNVILHQETVAAQQANVRLVTQDLRAAKDRFEVGEVTRTDVALAEAQLAAAKAQAAAAEGQLALAREEYKAAVGHYPENLAPLPKAPALPKGLADAQDIALASNPSLQAARHQALLSDLGVAMAKANTRPILGGSLTAQVAQSLDPTAPQVDTLTAGVSLSQTLYAGGKLSALYRQALNQQDAARAAVELTAVNVAMGVAIAWSGLDVAAASISAGDQQVKAAEAALNGVKEEAAVGARTTLDVLNAEQALLSARTARLQAVASLYKGEYGLLAAMGLMTASHLGLGVPQYDAQAYYQAVKSAPATSTRGAKLDKILKLMGRE